MHCQRINELDLIPVDENTNALKRFPLVVKRRIIKEVSDSLILSSKAFSEGSNILTSWGHVLWALEVLGQSFTLPFEDHLLIQNCASIYQKWLFSSGNDVPDAISNIRGSETEQQLWIKVASHFSLAFEPRLPMDEESSPNQIKIQGLNLLNFHLEICQNILKMMTLLIRHNASKFSSETWDILIKIILGLSDTLLREPILKKDITKVFSSSQYSVEERKVDIASYMGDKLAEPLFRLCLETLLRSATFSVELWTNFKLRILTWNHRKCIISDWLAFIMGLNRHFTNYLYQSRESQISMDSSNPSKPSSLIEIRIVMTNYNCEFNLSETFILYAWHNLFYSIGNPCNLTSSNFETAIKGFDILTKQILGFDLASIVTSKVKVHSNTLLKLYGGWLFEASLKSEVGYELGRAKAFECLSNICLQIQKTPIDFIYIQQYYSALLNGLEADQTTLVTILMSSSNIFLMGMQGARMLIPYFLKGISRYIAMETSMTLESKNSSSHIHSASVRLLASISSCCRSISKLKDVHNQFENFQLDIGNLLLYFFNNSTDVKIIKEALNALLVHLLEHAHINPKLISYAMQSIQIKMSLNSWSNEATIHSLDFINRIAEFHLHDKDQKEQILSLLNSITKLIEKKFVEKDIIASQIVLAKSYDCLSRWINLQPWIKLDKSCYKSILSCICHGIALLDKQDPTSASKLNDSFKRQDTPSSKSSSFEEKRRSKPPPPPPFKFAQKFQEILGASTVSIQPNVQSKSDPELSTFTILTAEIYVKNAADICMASILSRPVKEFSHGFLHGSSFDELQAVSEIIDLQHQLITDVQHDPINVKQIQSYLRYFSFQNQIIFGFLELPGWALKQNVPATLGNTGSYNAIDHPQVIVVVRDMSGRYTWLEKLNYGGIQDLNKPNNIDIENLEIFTPSPYPYASKNSQVIRIVAHNETSIPKINDIAFQEKEHYEQTKKMVEKQSIYELETLETKISSGQIKGMQPVSPPKRKDHLDPSNIPNAFRLFLAHYGFLDLHRLDELIPLSLTDDLLRGLNDLDAIKERDCMTVNIFFLDSAFEPIENIIQPLYLPHDFKSFFKSLGWVIHLETHQGYNGNLNAQTHEKCIYWANATEEILFYSPYYQKLANESSELTIVNNNDDKTEETPKITESFGQECEKFIKSNAISVIWIQQWNGYENIIQNHLFNQTAFFIFVNPLQDGSGLYRIYIKKNSEIVEDTEMIQSGPLMDGMLCSRSILGQSIRMTCISMYMRYKQSKSTYKRPFLSRRRSIEEICKRSKKSDSVLDIF